ncbi:hypothetical protein EHI8A_127090 [Entamoeba histolytica HM-1:IMSS-B]|uniref:Uncharacterized protein n=6 Tax=Entamoeba histolytica TaxID=5759 RepID=C4M6L5_ENTH1|nr:hypothetical protein EHI_147560 [Entamoeba histolytica HM-1:IMSS]EMD42650.1 Hypothetical protein EHI5A_132350 [Entamoeba histolytica KU27]EMH76510.1 hypothetical protein EHI8A_127090 [Entamoeba histolytica HM-1:IMSS-B]EMS10926.1 hypothetical protein KM1_118570 [Entamoeba histolytica HM-3:IMSS]ENY65879.1 hypothetical protein EHI7A_086280 [Entamoeba histolytica HM-1:IMSS-A]GAT97146.1 hypothetical protein CL6EHI_147560 [Entamoeba histolytica]|eukprot:XP_654523.1 hypothetical protein EHI_147560 [Entamoeba histolytica HM-1:IMSS]
MSLLDLDPQPNQKALNETILSDLLNNQQTKAIPNEPLFSTIPLTQQYENQIQEKEQKEQIKVDPFTSLKKLTKSKYYQEEFKEVEALNEINNQSMVKTKQEKHPIVSFDLNNQQIDVQERQMVDGLMEQQEKILVSNATNSGGIRIVPSESELKDFEKKMMGMDINKIVISLIETVSIGKGKQCTKALGYLKYLLTNKKGFKQICLENQLPEILSHVDVSSSIINELKSSVEEILNQ